MLPEKSRTETGVVRALSAVVAVIAVGLGVWLVLHPLASVRFAVTLLGVALIVAGALEFLSRRHRSKLPRAWGMVLGAVLVVFGALILLGPAAAVVVLAALAVGAYLPTRWLGRRVVRRRAALVRELPDLLDLLGICVEAGMALDPALALSSERLGGTVGDEIGRVLDDLRFGMPRADAYRSLVARVGAPELAQAVGALLQSEELGAPLSAALDGQAEALRASRRQAARDRAAKAAPKIQLVVALLMVPAALLLGLGGVFIELSRQVCAGMGGG